MVTFVLPSGTQRRSVTPERVTLVPTRPTLESTGSIWRPAPRTALARSEIRIVEVIAPDYEGFGPGGLAEDLKLGFGMLVHHHGALKRIAIVSTRNGSLTPCTHLRR